MTYQLRTGADSATVAALLARLPDWFGIESSNADYAAAADRLPGTTAYFVGDGMDDEPVGVALWERHFPQTTELHLLAVHPDHHRRGVGRMLVERGADEARQTGADLLEVKTLGPSRPNPEYDMTRLFYRALGFLPLEELHDLWDDNPCLVMVRPLR